MYNSLYISVSLSLSLPPSLYIYLCIAIYVDTGEAEMNNECQQG